SGCDLVVAEGLHELGGQHRDDLLELASGSEAAVQRQVEEHDPGDADAPADRAAPRLAHAAPEDGQDAHRPAPRGCPSTPRVRVDTPCCGRPDAGVSAATGGVGEGEAEEGPYRRRTLSSRSGSSTVSSRTVNRASVLISGSIVPSTVARRSRMP